MTHQHLNGKENLKKKNLNFKYIKKCMNIFQLFLHFLSIQTQQPKGTKIKFTNL